MDVDRLRNVSDLVPINGNLVRQHAWCWDLDGVGPVVVVVAEGIGKVEDGLLCELRCVLCDVEVSGLHTTLSD